MNLEAAGTLGPGFLPSARAAGAAGESTSGSDTHASSQLGNGAETMASSLGALWTQAGAIAGQAADVGGASDASSSLLSSLGLGGIAVAQGGGICAGEQLVTPPGRIRGERQESAAPSAPSLVLPSRPRWADGAPRPAALEPISSRELSSASPDRSSVAESARAGPQRFRASPDAPSMGMGNGPTLHADVPAFPRPGLAQLMQELGGGQRAGGGMTLAAADWMRPSPDGTPTSTTGRSTAEPGDRPGAWGLAAPASSPPGQCGGCSGVDAGGEAPGWGVAPPPVGSRHVADLADSFRSLSFGEPPERLGALCGTGPGLAVAAVAQAAGPRHVARSSYSSLPRGTDRSAPASTAAASDMTDLPDLSEEAMLVALPETNTAESAKSDHTSHSAQLGGLGWPTAEPSRPCAPSGQPGRQQGRQPDDSEPGESLHAGWAPGLRTEQPAAAGLPVAAPLGRRRSAHRTRGQAAVASLRRTASARQHPRNVSVRATTPKPLEADEEDSCSIDSSGSDSSAGET